MSYYEGDDWDSGRKRPRFSEMSAEEKLKVRKVERAEKKERQRTLNFFINVQEALKTALGPQQPDPVFEDRPVADEERDATAEGSATSNFKAVAEAAAADIVDGFCTDLCRRLKSDGGLLKNSTVCRVVEQALGICKKSHVEAIVYTLLGSVAELMAWPTASFVMEAAFEALSRVAVDSDVLSTGEVDSGLGGMPSVGDLLHLVVEEVLHGLSTLVWDKSGAKATASLLCSLIGLGSSGRKRQVPDTPLEHVSEKRLEDVGVLSKEIFALLDRAPSEEYNFEAACFHPAANFVIQALARCSARNATMGKRLSTRINKLLPSLIEDAAVGSRVVECYAAEGGAAAWTAVASTVASLDTAPPFVVAALVNGASNVPQLAQVWRGNISKTLQSLWLAPSETEDVDDINVLRNVSTIVRCCTKSVDPQLLAASEGDKEFNIPEFREEMGIDIIDACKGFTAKGTLKALLHDLFLGHGGAELVCALIPLGEKLSTRVSHGLLKLSIPELATVVKTSEGSRALQLMIDRLALVAARPKKPSPKPVAAPKPEGKGVDNARRRIQRKQEEIAKKEAAKEAAAEDQATALTKLFRRLKPNLVDLCKDKFASYVIQHIYEQGSLEDKTEVATALSEQFAALKDDFVAEKVLLKCFVEQFRARPEEWKMNASRRSNVKRLMASILAAE